METQEMCKFLSDCGGSMSMLSTMSDEMLAETVKMCKKYAEQSPHADSAKLAKDVDKDHEDNLKHSQDLENKMYHSEKDKDKKADAEKLSDDKKKDAADKLSEDDEKKKKEEEVKKNAEKDKKDDDKKKEDKDDEKDKKDDKDDAKKHSETRTGPMTTAMLSELKPHIESIVSSLLLVQ